MLLYNGIYSDLEIQNIIILLILAAFGAVIGLAMKKKRTLIIFWLAFCLILALLELGSVLPVPSSMSGDGYAITQELSLISLSFYCPFLAGFSIVSTIKLALMKKSNQH